jgi:hypothetical protein
MYEGIVGRPVEKIIDDLTAEELSELNRDLKPLLMLIKPDE